MVGTIVTFQYGDDFDRAKLEGVARDSAHMFEGLPGLRSKMFTLDEQSRRAVNVYVWETQEQATGFLPPSSSRRPRRSTGSRRRASSRSRSSAWSTTHGCGRPSRKRGLQGATSICAFCRRPE